MRGKIKHRRTHPRAQGDLAMIFGRPLLASALALVLADDACNEAKGIAAAKKLIYEDKVFMILGHPCSGVAMAIKPMLDKEDFPWIGISANPKLTRPTVPSMFHA